MPNDSPRGGPLHASRPVPTRTERERHTAAFSRRVQTEICPPALAAGDGSTATAGCAQVHRFLSFRTQSKKDEETTLLPRTSRAAFPGSLRNAKRDRVSDDADFVKRFLEWDCAAVQCTGFRFYCTFFRAAEG